MLFEISGKAVKEEFPQFNPREEENNSANGHISSTDKHTDSHLCTLT